MSHAGPRIRPAKRLSNVIRDAQRLRRDRQPRVDRRGRREERRIDDEQVVDVVRAAERIEHRRARIGAEAERAALMRRVLLLVRVRDDDPEAETPEDALHFRDELLVCATTLFGR